MEIVCRLCLIEVKNDFEVIDNIGKEILNVLLLGMDVEVRENPVMCGSCAESVNKFFHFKSMFLNIEQCILSFAVDKREANFELIDIIEDDLDLKTLCGGFNTSICRFCMKQLERSNFASMDIIIKEVMDMLPVFVPEMDFNIIQDAVICLVCKENLESYIMFVNNYLDLEEKKDGYCQNKPIDNACQPSRHNILQYFLPKHTQISSTKQEEEKKEKTMHSGVCALLFKCALCAFETKQKRYLKSHMIKHKAKSEGELHKCALCTYKTQYKYHLKVHMLEHKGISEIKLYKCTICAYEAQHKYNLNYHMLKHKINVSFKCASCSYETRYKGNLKCHIIKHKNTSEIKLLKCTVCGFQTKYKTAYKNHTLKHKDVSEVVMYKCGICAYETKYSHYLKSHMLKHKDISEVELHKCTICSYETKRSRYLKRHMLKHKDISEVESFKCTLCTYETKYKHHIKSHMKTHKDV